MTGYFTHVWIIHNISSNVTCTLYASITVQVADNEPQVLNSYKYLLEHHLFYHKKNLKKHSLCEMWVSIHRLTLFIHEQFDIRSFPVPFFHLYIQGYARSNHSFIFIYVERVKCKLMLWTFWLTKQNVSIDLFSIWKGQKRSQKLRFCPFYFLFFLALLCQIV